MNFPADEIRSNDISIWLYAIFSFIISTVTKQKMFDKIGAKSALAVPRVKLTEFCILSFHFPLVFLCENQRALEIKMKRGHHPKANAREMEV